MDIVYITLILCLVASNLDRLRRIFNWLLEYFTRPQEPQLIPYFNEEVHNHSTFTHSSLHHPDGSLAFLDYVPRYTVSIKESIALAVDSNDDHGGLFPGDSGVDPSIDSSIESLEEAHSGSEHIGSEEEREMREDPEAGTDDEIDELDDSD
ncbi:hypothetical protein MVEN_00028600 [Mycena venus]|uniref:Uncharacterized protein n=1 Tax=Mycena venus TaxID=2733690 RepID=A0A8H6Z8H3_9AGAR|nr:hypothetical protein MVEN_00028600 [Mycena venus]